MFLTEARAAVIFYIIVVIVLALPARTFFFCVLVIIYVAWKSRTNLLAFRQTWRVQRALTTVYSSVRYTPTLHTTVIIIAAYYSVWA